MNLYYHKRIGLDMKYFWSEIMRFIPSLLVPIIVGTLMVLFMDMNKFIVFLICGIFYVIIFCISMWFLGMNQYEKNLVGKPILKLIERNKIK